MTEQNLSEYIMTELVFDPESGTFKTIVRSELSSRAEMTLTEMTKDGFAGSGPDDEL